MDTRLSKNEARLFELVKRAKKPITTDELTKRFYRDGGIPKNGRVYIANLIRSIKSKGDELPEAARLQSTEGSGRRALEVWLA